MMPRYLLFSFTAGFLFCIFVSSLSIARPGDPEYLPGRIIVKLEDADTFINNFDAGTKKIDNSRQNSFGNSNKPLPVEILTESMSHHGLMDMQPVFREGASANVAQFKRQGSQSTRLQELAEGFERTYTVYYSSGEDPQSLALEISKLSGVAYAEPHYVHKLLEELIPDDSLLGNSGQNYFEYLNFYEAWAVSTGSPDVVIAIIDSGVYYDHPDLINKLWYNDSTGRANSFFPNSEIVNDTIGWNFWESGNIFAGEERVQNANPVGNYNRHGTHVAGTAAADTDNGIGIAGTGFHSKFMPVKVGGTKEYPDAIAFGFQGILYAAINKADVINCSFGGPGFSELGQEIIDFAIESGSVVVAAAGNEGDDVLIYPGAYDDVLTVGSVKRERNDVISRFSSFGYHLDVFAIGEGLLSTYFDYDDDENSWDPRYQQISGTSMATPVVSGLAALIKAQNPLWSPQRIAAQIRVNARSIDAINSDSKYEYQLGKGVIDAHAALVNVKPGVSILDYAFKKPDGSKINTGESGTLTIRGINYGETASNLLLEIARIPSGISVEPTVFDAGEIGNDEEFSATFNVSISDDFRLDEIPLFRLDMSEPSSEYNDFYMFDYEQLLYDIMDINTITVSISSDGTIGFLDALASSGGVGFIPDDYENMLYEGGLLISADLRNDDNVVTEQLLINQIRDSTEITRHFLPLENYRITTPGTVSDVDGRAAFRSSKHPVFDELDIEMETFAFASGSTDQSFFIKYNITNNSLATLHNMHVGLFNDWDIHEYSTNHTGFDASDSLLYVYNPSGAPYIAVAQMNAVSSAFAIDNLSPISLSEAATPQDSLQFGINYDVNLDNFDGFTDAEKRIALTAGSQQTTIAESDISVVTASGPFTLHPLAKVTVGFIYAWGEDLDDLRSQVSAARALQLFETSRPGEYTGFRELADDLTLFQNFPNPFNNITTLEFHLSEPGQVNIDIYNVLGQRVATLLNEQVENRARFVNFDASGLASGIYIAVLRAEGRTEVVPMTLVK